MGNSLKTVLSIASLLFSQASLASDTYGDIWLEISPSNRVYFITGLCAGVASGSYQSSVETINAIGKPNGKSNDLALAVKDKIKMRYCGIKPSHASSDIAKTITYLYTNPAARVVSWVDMSAIATLSLDGENHEELLQNFIFLERQSTINTHKEQ